MGLCFVFVLKTVGNLGIFSLVLKVVAKSKGLFLIPQMK